MVREIRNIAAVCALLLPLAGCGDDAQVSSAPPQSSGVTIEAQPEAPAATRSEDIPQVPAAPAGSAEPKQATKSADTKPISFGLAIRIGDSPVTIDLSTGKVVLTPPAQ